MTVYYIDSKSGSNSNVGTSAERPFASLSSMDSIKLKPGDSVLLKSGQTFVGQLNLKGQGTAEKPVTIGSYGAGEKPVITSGEVGIHGSKTSFVTVKGIAIENTKGNAIYAGSAHDWVIDNVTVKNTGSATKPGSISFQSSENITIQNSTLSGVKGDGVWMLNVKGATLVGNTVSNSVGHDADAIQLNKTTNVLIQKNTLDMSGDTGSAKGVLVLVDTKNAVIDGNTLKGGGFGLGVYGENVTITHNEISDYKGYSWSYGIGLGAQVNAKNYLISGNYIHDGVWGVSISSPTGDNVLRLNIEVAGNLFDKLSDAALKIDRVATGSFHDNVIAAGVKDMFISTLVSKMTGFNATNSSVAADAKALFEILVSKVSGGGLTVPPADASHTATDIPGPIVSSPVPKPLIFAAQNDKAVLDGHSGLEVSGNVLANDSTDTGTLSLRNLNGSAFKKAPVQTINSDHGTLKIDANGNYSFKLDLNSLSENEGILTDSFQYKVSNGAKLDVAYLTVQIDSHSVLDSHSGDFFI